MLLSFSPYRPSMSSPDPYSQQPMTPRPSSGGGGVASGPAGAPRSPSQGPTSPFSVGGGKLMPPGGHEGGHSPRHQPNSPIDPYAQQPGSLFVCLLSAIVFCSCFVPSVFLSFLVCLLACLIRSFLHSFFPSVFLPSVRASFIHLFH